MEARQIAASLLLFLLLLMTNTSTNGAAAPLNPSEIYWKKKLGDKPMPDSIKKMIPSQTSSAEAAAAASAPEEKTNVDAYHKSPPKQIGWKQHFFMAKDLRPGLMLDVRYSTEKTSTSFLPPQAAKSLTFSPFDLPELFKNLSADIMDRNPFDTEVMVNTIDACYFKHSPRNKYCAKSLESMIDYVTSRLGKNVKAVTSEGFPQGSKSPFTILEVKEVTNVRSGVRSVHDSVVNCHKSSYWPYAVFVCHTPPNAKPYELSLVDANGNKFKGLISCHILWFTRDWQPYFDEVNEVEVELDGSAVCHFMEANDIAWVPDMAWTPN